MARSTRSTRTARSARTTTTAAPSASSNARREQMRRNLKYLNFSYQRDDVSHGRNASYVAITDRQSGTPITMSLQEARSLYNFLEAALS